MATEIIPRCLPQWKLNCLGFSECIDLIVCNESLDTQHPGRCSGLVLIYSWILPWSSTNTEERYCWSQPPVWQHPQVLPSSSGAVPEAPWAAADRTAADPQCPLLLHDAVVHRVHRDSFEQEPLPPGNMFMWFLPLALDPAEHLRANPAALFFLPGIGTGVLLFNMKKSQSGVTSLATPAEELLVENILGYLWTPSCNRSDRWSPTWTAEPECVFLLWDSVYPPAQWASG